MEVFLAELWQLITNILSSEAFIGLVVTAVGSLATLIIRQAAGAFEAATGMEIEKKHREALHSAIKTSTEAAIRHGPEMGFANLRAHVTAHLHESVPDALARLAPGGPVIDRLIERYSAEFLDRALPRQTK